MKKIWYVLLSFLLLYISFASFRLSLPLFEIKQAILNKQKLINSGVNMNMGGVFVSNVEPNSPASIGGIVEGTQITSLNGQKVVDRLEFVSVVSKNLGKPITLGVCKSNDCSEIKLTPRVNSPAGQGPLGVTLLDISTLNKSIGRIVFDEIYKKFTGQSFFDTTFGGSVVVLTWASFVVGIVTFVLFVRLISRVISSKKLD